MGKRSDLVIKNCPEPTSGKKFQAFEDILPYIGEFGKYQWILVLAIFPFSMSLSNIFSSHLFILAVPRQHWCKINELMDLNLTQNQRIDIAIPKSKEYPYHDRCHHKKLNFQNLSIQKKGIDNSSKWETIEKIKCTDWEYNFDEIPYTSMGVEMNWVCDQEYLLSTTQSVFFIGSALGNFIFGWISDRKGRVVSLIFCTLIAFIGSIAIANAYNFWTFSLSRFILGFAFDNIITIPLFIVLEYVPINTRTTVIFLTFGLYVTISFFIISWLPYFIRDWRIYAYVISLSHLLCFFVACMLPESCRWYMSKGMSDKILKKLRRISQVNGKIPDSCVYDEFCEGVINEKRNIESANLFDLMKMPHLAINTLILAIVFSLCTLTVSTHMYFTRQYKISIFSAMSWFGVENFFAALFVKVTLDRWGRRICGFTGLLLASVFCFVIVFSKSEDVKLVAGGLGRLSILFVLTLMGQYVPEFFPTTVRTQGAALVHFATVIMNFVAPYIILLTNMWRELPLLIIGMLALLNSILILFLPETVGKRLPQTLQDGEDSLKDKKFWSFK